MDRQKRAHKRTPTRRRWSEKRWAGEPGEPAALQNIDRELHTSGHRRVGSFLPLAIAAAAAAAATTLLLNAGPQQGGSCAAALPQRCRPRGGTLAA